MPHDSRQQGHCDADLDTKLYHNAAIIGLKPELV
jgi:hypothetical protein